MLKHRGRHLHFLFLFMKQINTYITEKLKISKNNTSYTLFPETTEELDKMVATEIANKGPNCSLNHIDVSGLEDLSYVFSNTKFNGDISEWDVSNVTCMRRMFKGSKFNGDISKWDVSNVNDMRGMFDKCPLQNNPPKWYKE